jgi:CheY-like chemotaxis protein
MTDWPLPAAGDSTTCWSTTGLPDLSGVELIRLLRADPRTMAVPLVLFTGDSSAQVERDARWAGADDFLAKPVEPLLLEERMMRLLVSGTRRAVS